MQAAETNFTIISQNSPLWTETEIATTKYFSTHSYIFLSFTAVSNLCEEYQSRSLLVVALFSPILLKTGGTW
jgi:hypothetical protein